MTLASLLSKISTTARRAGAGCLSHVVFPATVTLLVLAPLWMPLLEEAARTWWRLQGGR